MYKWSKTQCIAITGMFTALIFLLTFLGIGFITIFVFRPTILHIPVIIGALLMGPKYGAVLGFMFGLSSMMFATFSPVPTSFVFSPFLNVPGTDSGNMWAFVVAFVPRILVGVVPWYVFIGLRKLLTEKMNVITFAITGIAGALTNTLLVMHFIFLMFGNTWNAARAQPAPADALYAAIWGIVATNGVPEAIASAILVGAIMGALMVVIDKTVGIQKR